MMRLFLLDTLCVWNWCTVECAMLCVWVDWHFRVLRSDMSNMMEQVKLSMVDLLPAWTLHRLAHILVLCCCLALLHIACFVLFVDWANWITDMFVDISQKVPLILNCNCHRVLAIACTSHMYFTLGQWASKTCLVVNVVAVLCVHRKK